jgi:hypothetical protein
MSPLTSCLVEDRDMLADNLQNWAKKERQEGVNEGRMTALESTLRNQVKLKFGEMPVWADHRIQQADDIELSEWVVKIVSADSLEALLQA